MDVLDALVKELFPIVFLFRMIVMGALRIVDFRLMT